MSRTKLVLLDGTFVAALTDASSPWHTDAVAIYRHLVAEFALNRVRLVAASDTLDELHPTARTLLAPVDRLRISASQRKAAARVQAGFVPATALTLVLATRERIDEIASFDSELRQFAVALVTVPPATEDDMQDDPPAPLADSEPAAVSSGFGPPTGPPATV